MNQDRQMALGRSLVQHGPNSDRVYLMKAAPSDLPGLPDRLVSLASEKGYGKVFAKVPASFEAAFRTRGFVREARIPGYYRGREDGLFLGLYRKKDRARDRRAVEAARIRDAALAKRPKGAPPLPPGLVCRPLGDSDFDDAARLYRVVFATYPFPIHDPTYLRETARSHVAYQGVFRDGRLLAVASAEVDREAAAAEMTDFATDPAQVGRGLARHLLESLTDEMFLRGIRTVMTIARALSPGMNAVFARCGFRYGGMLVNNTGICGGIESMNVWHKPLPVRRAV